MTPAWTRRTRIENLNQNVLSRLPRWTAQDVARHRASAQIMARTIQELSAVDAVIRQELIAESTDRPPAPSSDCRSCGCAPGSNGHIRERWTCGCTCHQRPVERGLTMLEHGAEVGVDWVSGLVLHEGDADWHPWDETVYGPRRESDAPPLQPAVNAEHHAERFDPDVLADDADAGES